MSDLKLRQNGLRILDSRNGDLMIVNPALNISCLFTFEFIDQAKEDPQKMATLGKKFVEFVEAHTEARWRKAKKEIFGVKVDANGFAFLLSDDDIAFGKKMQPYFDLHTIDALRKIEKDIFFRKQNHAKRD